MQSQELTNLLETKDRLYDTMKANKAGNPRLFCINHSDEIYKACIAKPNTTNSLTHQEDCLNTKLAKQKTCHDLPATGDTAAAGDATKKDAVWMLLLLYF